MSQIGMKNSLTQEADYTYLEIGEGQPIVILHGLMGGLSNFEGVTEFFPEKGYKVIIPELPIYDLPLKQTTVKSFSEFLLGFLDFKGLSEVILLGNSLGGHIGLVFSKNYPERVKALVLTGSSGLYENSMGESYPKKETTTTSKPKAKMYFTTPK